MQNDIILQQKPFDFVSVENPNTEEVGVKITSGEFAGVVFTIGKISFDEEGAEGDCKLKFDYEIRVGDIEEDRKEEFENSLGNMILYLLMDSINRGEVANLIGESNGSA